MERYPSIDVIIPTLNEAENLPACLDAIFRQDYPRDRLRVTVVDGGSTDNTRALATRPTLLLLDEVMAGLTPTEITETVDVVLSIRDSGITIFLIEHVMQAVMSLSDRAYVLNQGSLTAEDAPADIAADPAVIEAYLGHGAAARIAAQGGADA